jgi:hypothetical protein
MPTPQKKETWVAGKKEGHGRQSVHMARTPVESLPIGRPGTEKYSLLLDTVQKPAKVKSI